MFPPPDTHPKVTRFCIPGLISHPTASPSVLLSDDCKPQPTPARQSGSLQTPFTTVSQGDATEKLAHQVPTQTAAAHRRLEEASGHPHAQEKDETHKSSKGHVSEPAVVCRISLESPTQREAPPAVDMNANPETEKASHPSLPNIRTKGQSRRGSEIVVKMRDLPHRSRPPD
ncbi:hypothetical protein Q8A67_006265 [Cirrhinus molitorella]|uniref:Uncharacterized protein n=1 Tax=Cirrhinus molitorella TaxID=172907 RepID=A0AA88QA88_9TELE|nr:hypothetical protein Q8A67_006265 [Cirrhinus molitorella]